MEPLEDAELALVTLLADRLDRAPEAVLEALLGPPEDPGQVATTLEDGRFTRLSLRAIGPRLRWAEPEGDLLLDLRDLVALEELDVSGLDLNGLTLDLPALQRLDASGNQLRSLELGALPALRVLDVAANQLMVLDLRAQPDLWFLDASGNELTGLLVPSPNRLKIARLKRNQLMVLDLQHCPDLTELDAARNALVSLTLEAPRLRRLQLHDNQLGALDLRPLPALRHLAVGRNRLATLDLSTSTALRELKAGRNYLDHLDLSALTALEEVRLGHNQLTTLELGPCPALATLQVAHNRLEQLDLGAVPSLQRLDCANNRIQALDLSANGALCELIAEQNQLTELDLRPAARLARAELGANPLTDVLIGDSPVLAVLELPAGTSVQTPTGRAGRFTRKRPASSRPAELDRPGLHRFAATYDEPDREAVLLELVRDTERCALGTAVMVYWMSSPHYYLRFDDREEVPAYAQVGWDLLETIEENVRAGAYRHDDVFFDPRHDQQTVDVLGRDWTRFGDRDAGPVPPAFLTLPRGLR